MKKGFGFGAIFAAILLLLVLNARTSKQEVATEAKVEAKALPLPAPTARVPANTTSMKTQVAVLVTKELTSEERAEALKKDEAYRNKRAAYFATRTERLNRLRDPLHPIRFTTNDQNYEFLPNVYAVPRGKYSPNMGDLVEREWGYAFFQGTPNQGLPQGASAVAYSATNQHLVVITGALSIKFKSGDFSNQFSQEFNLTTIQTMEEISVAYFQSSRTNMSELVSLINALRGDARVARADLHIVDKLYVGR